MTPDVEIAEIKRRLDDLSAEASGLRRRIEALESSYSESEHEHVAFAPPPLPTPSAVSGQAFEMPAIDDRAAAGSGIAGGGGREDAERSQPSAVIAWLRLMQLWPPAAEPGSREARLGAWWATRIGALLAVVGVAFFGVYMSAYSTPLIRFIELLIIACAAVFAGTRLERRSTSFGRVVLAGGLALLDFAAYAGHALPAVRVFDSAAMSLAAQTAAIGLMIFAALKRNAQGIATMALALGFASIGATARSELAGAALPAASLLAAVAIGLQRARGWEGASVVAMPAGYLLFVSRVAEARGLDGTGDVWGQWAFLFVVATGYVLRDWRRGRVDAALVSAGEKWFQNANAGMALGAGLWAALAWHRASLEWYYLAAAGWCGAAAWLRSRWFIGRDVVCSVLLAKATGALALAVIELAGARSAPVALLVQSAVMSWTARRTGSRVLGYGALATGLLAAALFYLRAPVSAGAVWSLETLRVVAFGLGVLALASEGERVRWTESTSARRLAIGAAALCGGLALALLAWTRPPHAWAPVYALVLAGGAALIATLRKGGAAAWAACALVALGQVWMWGLAMERHGEGLSAGVAALVVCAAVGVSFVPYLRRVAVVARGAAVIGAALTAFAFLPGTHAIAAVATGALCLAAAPRRFDGAHLSALAVTGLAVGVFRWVMLGAHAEFTALAAVAALAAWCAVVLCRRAEAPVASGLGVIPATAIGAIVAAKSFAGSNSLWAFIALFALAATAVRPGRVRHALGAVWLIGSGLTLAVVFIGLAGLPTHDFGGWFFAAAGAGLALGAAPLWLSARPDTLGAKFARVAGGAAGLSALFAVFAGAGGTLGPYATVGWAAAAITWFMAGVFRRERIHRVLGLVGLALCVSRMLIVDLHSALHRIIAFIALGLVLLWVGFSYERFRHFISDNKSAE